MRRSTILIISILTMLLLAGSLMGFSQTFYVNTNRDGVAYIEIRTYPAGELVYRIPASGTFNIYWSWNVQQIQYGLDNETVYQATCFAHGNTSPTYYDSDSIIIGYTTGPVTFQIDISGKVPDDPPGGD